jgi:hypothetical protein
MDDTRGVGWLTFAATILIFEGIMRFFDSLWAFRYKGNLPEGLQNAAFGSTLKSYGWIYLFVGLLLVLAGFSVLYRGQVARWLGVFAGAIGGLSAMAWLPYYPIWSLIYIALAVMVMYALIAYGGRTDIPA